MLTTLTPLDRAILSLVRSAYPRRFRERFGRPIEETFLDRVHEAKVHGTYARFLTAFLFDGLVTAGRERFTPALPPATARGPRRIINMRQTFQTLFQDLRLAVRHLGHRPGFAVAAVGTLALGFGGNTAIFSVINGVLLQPLPFNEPERLVRIDVAPDEPGGAPGSMAYPDIEDILAQATSLETLVGLNPSRQTLTGSGDPRVLESNRLTEGLFDTFQTAPLLGRDIRQEEFGTFTPGAAVAVLNHSLWQNQFNGDSDVIGRTISLNGFSYEIVGVGPRGFNFPEAVDVWIPRFLDIEGCGRGCHTMRTIGRLAPGATVSTLQAELDEIGIRLEQAYPETNTEKRFLARSLQDVVVGDVRQGLIIVMVSVVLVLLIACANVANLLLASAAGREGELAVRAALGASRKRMMSQVFTESFVLAALGAVVGLVMAFLSVSAFRALAAETIPRMEEVAVDGVVLLWTLGGVVLVTLLFGLVPAFSVSRNSLASGISSISRRAGSDRRTTRFRAVLLVAEVCLSVTLLIGAGLLLRTFTELYRVDLGYETQNIVRFRLGLPQSEYESLERVRTFYRTLEERIGATPGVESVASAFGPPLGSGNATGTVLIAGRPIPEPSQETEAAIHPVSPEYFETMRIPIQMGRGLTPADDAVGENVAVINAAFVRDNFGDEDPMGKSFRLTVDMGYGSPTWRIVGVTPDIRSRSLESTAPPMAYVSHGKYGPNTMHVIVRTAPDTPFIIPAVRDIVRSMDPNLPMYSIETLDEVIRERMAPTTLYLSLVAAFAIVAAVLSAVGLYGVVSFIVSSRSREIGVRIALGAGQSRVMRHIIGRGMRPVIAGLIFGLLLAGATGQILQSVLYGVQPRDPFTYMIATALLTLVAFGAVSIPAVRATRVNPARTLRDD